MTRLELLKLLVAVFAETPASAYAGDVYLLALKQISVPYKNPALEMGVPHMTGIETQYLYNFPEIENSDKYVEALEILIGTKLLSNMVLGKQHPTRNAQHTKVTKSRKLTFRRRNTQLDDFLCLRKCSRNAVRGGQPQCQD